MICTLERAAVNGGHRQHRQCFSQLLRLLLSMLSKHIITRADVTKFTIRPGFPMANENEACGGQSNTPFVELLLPAGAGAPLDYRLSAKVVTGISAGTSDSRIKLLKEATCTPITSRKCRSCTSMRAN